MPIVHALARSIALFALILALSACGEDGSPATPLPSAAPSSLRVLGGDGQHGVAGSALAEEIAVGAVDAGGTALPGQPVQFVVISGGGRVTPQTVTSDARGLARAQWTLGTAVADSQVVEARREGLPPVRLRATVRPDVPATLTVTAGNGASGPVGAPLDSLVVTVRDRFGNPVPGLAVAWDVVAGGGSVSPARTVTGADGVAKTQWTLGARVDSAQGVLVRVAGLDSVAFTASAVTAGVPLQLAKRGGDGQRGAAGSILLDSLGVVLRMADGRPVQGAVVQWSVPAAAGTVTPAVSRTDASGAASTVWRLGTNPGLAQATATVDGGTLVFTSLIQSAAPASLVAVAGGGEGPVGGALADSLAVRVTDAYGNPVPGAEVAWEALEGGGTVQPATSVTDAQGIARAQWMLGPRVGTQQAAQARLGSLPPIAFTASAVTAGVPLQLAKRGGDGQRGAAGSILLDSLGVVLRMPDGRPVQGAVVQWNVPVVAGTVTPAVSRTDASGAASTVWRLGTNPGLAQATATVDGGTLVFTSLIQSAAPAVITAVAGGGEGPVGGALADSLAVRVTDAYGNPVPGAEVAWEALDGGGAVQPATRPTDAQGIARARWTLGTAVGEPAQTARATLPGLPPVEFEATGTTLGVPLRLTRVGGDRQTGRVGRALADSLAVRLETPEGVPVSGARVIWVVTAGGGQLSPAIGRTDTDGRARAAWTMGSAPGAASATATVDEGSLVFTATGHAGPPAVIRAIRGDGQRITRGMQLYDSLVVQVADSSGLPIAGVEVRWGVDAGDGQLMQARSTTGADGRARNLWAVGFAPGQNRVTAQVDGIPGAPFTATALPGTLRLRAKSEIGGTFGFDAAWRISGRFSALVTDSLDRRTVSPPVTWEYFGNWGSGVRTSEERLPWEPFSFFNVGTERLAKSLPLPYARARFEAQSVLVPAVTYTSFFDWHVELPDGLGPYSPNDTVRVIINLPWVAPGSLGTVWYPTLHLRDDNGWTAVHYTSYPIEWPLGSRTGTRTLTYCLPEPDAIPEDCRQITVAVAP